MSDHCYKTLYQDGENSYLFFRSTGRVLIFANLSLVQLRWDIRRQS